MESCLELQVNDEVFSYQSMGAEDQIIEYSPSNAEAKSRSGSRASFASNAGNKSTRNLFKQPPKHSHNALNSSRNHLKSKEIAKDILNKSGVFSKLKNSKFNRVGTLATPFLSGTLNKSSVTPSKMKSKHKPVFLRNNHFRRNLSQGCSRKKLLGTNQS
jgi:hypothetical protein